MTINEIEKLTIEEIDKTINVFNDHLKKIQLGTIDTDWFYGISINDKGKKNNLKNLAVITLKDDIIIIKPNNSILSKEIEKSINNFKKDMPLKFSIITEKTQILLKFDLTITQEIRNVFVSLCSKKSEEFRISLRNLRHDSFKKIKSLIKNDEEFKRNTKNIQLQFDKANKIIDDKEKFKITSLLKD
jgi:ribosome recycling factor